MKIALLSWPVGAACKFFHKFSIQRNINPSVAVIFTNILFAYFTITPFLSDLFQGYTDKMNEQENYLSDFLESLLFI